MTPDYFRLKQQSAIEFAKEVWAELEKHCGNVKIAINDEHYKNFGQQIMKTLECRGFFVSCTQFGTGQMYLNISLDKPE
jgi:hypothetical protein